MIALYEGMMPTFGDLLTSVTPQAQEILDFIWSYRLTNGDWPTHRVTFGKFKKEELLAILRALDGALIREYEASNGQKAFQLPLLGILATNQGPRYRDLLLRYLSYMRDVFFREHGINSINHTRVRDALKLSSEDTATLGRLVDAGFLRSSGGHNADFSEWGTNLPIELEDLPSEGSVQNYFDLLLNRHSGIAQPVLLTERTAVSAKFSIPPSLVVPEISEGRAKQPAVFLSYSHDSKEHKMWVLELAQTLHLAHIDVILDQWDLGPGDDVVKFMEHGVTTADRVLMICTEPYVRKVNEGKGGAGYEGTVVTGELIKDLGTAKFVPIVRQAGTHDLPTCVSTRAWINLSMGADIDDEIKKLVSSLRKEPPASRPPRGASPALSKMRSADPVVTPTHVDVATSIVVPSSSDAKAPGEVYEIALKLAREKDLVQWRKLATRQKSQADEALKVWRETAEKNLPKVKKELPDFMFGGVQTQAALFALAVAGVESGEDKFRGQASLVYDVLQPRGWERSGVTLVVDFPEANVFVLQALLGSMCVYSEQIDLAIDLATQRVTDRYHPSQSLPLFLDHRLTAWPAALDTTATTAWDFLVKLPERFSWLGDAFGSAESYRESLVGYFQFLSWLEYIYYIKEHDTIDRTKIRLDIPPVFMRATELSAGIRRMLLGRAALVAYGSKLGVSADRQRNCWTEWTPLFSSWMENVYHWPFDQPVDIQHFAADVHR